MKLLPTLPVVRGFANEDEPICVTGTANANAEWLPFAVGTDAPAANIQRLSSSLVIMMNSPHFGLQDWNALQLNRNVTLYM